MWTGRITCGFGRTWHVAVVSMQLRNQINTGAAVPREVLERYEIPIVASVLKLYLLELPGKFPEQFS